MDTYPLTLQYGIVSVYKLSNRSTFHNIKAPNNFNWGTVYQISNYQINMAQLGDCWLFNGSNVICRLAVQSVSYFFIEEAKLVTKDINN